MNLRLVGTTESMARFFSATQFFQNSLGAVWLIDCTSNKTDSCYEIKESECVKHCETHLRAIAIAAGCHIERIKTEA